MPGLRTECFASQSIWYHRGVTSPCIRLTVTLTLTSSWMKYTVPWPPPVRISCSSAPTSTSLSRLVFYFWFYNPRARHREMFEGHSGSLGKSCLGIYSFQWQILSLFIWVCVGCQWCWRCQPPSQPPLRPAHNTTEAWRTWFQCRWLDISGFTGRPYINE